MSDSLVHLFDEATKLHEVDDTGWLRELVRVEVSAVLAREQWHAHSSNCRLSDIGDFLMRAVTLLSNVATGVTSSRQIETYAKSRIEEMKLENDFSELNPLYDLDEKHSLLLAIASRLQKTSQDVTQIWKGGGQVADTLDHSADWQAGRSLTAPGTSLSPTRQSALHGSSEVLSWRDLVDRECEASGQPGGRSADHLAADADSAESESMRQETEHDLSSLLSRRGKGQHICPEWRTCKKGGMKNGRPVPFERNSAFRAHLDKHERPYKCEIRGCDKSFGRPDHLKRHRQKEHPV